MAYLMKAIQWLKERVNLTVPSTIGFLLLAAALVYLCVRIVGNVAKSELKDDASPDNLTAAQTVSPTAEPTPEALDEAALILVPEEAASGAATPDGTLIVSPAPAATPTLAPSPTPRPLVTASKFGKGHMDVLLVGLDENGRADSYVIVAVRANACHVIFIPRNTLSTGDHPLSNATDVRSAISRLEDVMRVRFTYYLQFEVEGIPTLVDELGGVSVGGGNLSGERAAAYLESGGSDEMLRIERQQVLLRALLSRVQNTSWLKLIALKYTLAGYFKSNLMLTQSAELFSALKKVDTDDISFSTLPVDSVTLDQTRYYRADTRSMARILDALYPAE